jgi:hypothetical protein
MGVTVVMIMVVMRWIVHWSFSFWPNFEINANRPDRESTEANQ